MQRAVTRKSHSVHQSHIVVLADGGENNKRPAYAAFVRDSGAESGCATLTCAHAVEHD
jgi:hypothetical protein